MGATHVLRARPSILWLLLFAWLPMRAWSDDPPAAPPQPLPAQPGELPAPGVDPVAQDPVQVLEAPQGPVDLRAFALTLQGQLEGLRTAPRKTPTDHALFDAWVAILEPRAGRMVARLKRIAEEPRWTPPTLGAPRVLKPGSWDVVVREAAALYAELGGALAQYARFRVNFVPAPGVGLGSGLGPPDPSAQERALERLAALEAALTFRLSTGGLIWSAELGWYWNLASRAELEMRRYQQDLARWEREVAAFEDLQARIAYGLAFQRQTLSMLMFGLRAFVAGLQAAEEDRLRVLVVALPADHPRRTEADEFLEAMRTARNAAEAHAGAEPAGWGTLLRQRWNGPRLRLLSLLS